LILCPTLNFVSLASRCGHELANEFFGRVANSLATQVFADANLGSRNFLGNQLVNELQRDSRNQDVRGSIQSTIQGLSHARPSNSTRNVTDTASVSNNSSDSSDVEKSPSTSFRSEFDESTASRFGFGGFDFNQS
jgi:hypothetical protein